MNIKMWKFKYGNTKCENHAKNVKIMTEINDKCENYDGKNYTRCENYAKYGTIWYINVVNIQDDKIHIMNVNIYQERRQENTLYL